jgi:uncharacterized protein YpuA (DUF1002 family)
MKRKLIAAVMSAICIMTAAAPSYIVLADGQKVVTLGADLSEDQKNAILRYFGIAGQNIQTLTITNADEREHLGSYVPLEQIGTHTYSCALVSPTNSGGIQVKTANLSWVTSNMIASTLSTSGVVNCDVLAAAPFEVSGTGALTGILMAYESAVGTTLDTTKKEVATQELITTTTIADSIGQVNATEIVNDTKMQVIEGNVISDNDINVIINEVAAEQNVTLSDDDRALLTDLMQQIAQQDYNYEEMKETLERVDANLQELSSAQNSTETAADATEQTEATAETEALASDSILLNTDDSALGESVIFDATNTEALSETESQQSSDSFDGFEITSSDSYGDTASTDSSVEIIGDTAQEETPATEIIQFDGDEAFSVDPEENTVSDDENAEVPAEENVEAEETAAAITADEMVFAPITSDKNSYTVYPAGQNELTIYIQREAVAAGSGTLTVTAADGSVTDSIQLSDTEKVSIEAMTDEELQEQGWNTGVKAVIVLPTALDQYGDYQVSLSADAFLTADGASSEEIPSGSWEIQTSEYGIYLEKKASGITAGSTVTGYILMDGTAAIYADIENADPSQVDFDVAEFETSGSFNATFYAAGKTTFQVVFYDADGAVLDTIDYTVVVK